MPQGHVHGFAFGLAFAVSLTGCADGLKLVRIDSSAKRPSNVAVYFTVDTSDRKPVPGLAADHFTIYEDGSKVSEFESKQTILNPKVAAAHDTLLLIDMSGSVVESNHVDDVVSAATQFTQRVEKFQKVGVYAFDGSTDLYPIVPFTESESAATSGVARLKTFKPKDPSTNLNGAVVEALNVLKRTLDQETKPLRFGTLVVFTDGTDRAARVSKRELDAALGAPEHAAYDIFAIGVGAEMNDSHLEDIGRTGTIKETDQANMGRAFDQIGAKIEGMTARYYLLSYCTPSRKGEHEVRIEAHADKELRGSLAYRFVADGFGPTCDPNTPPSFDLAHPAAAPPPDRTAERNDVPHKPTPKATVTVTATPGAAAAPAATETFAP
jgi:Mg-chelatase subunit ChlD